jgi:hypothetical protein
MIVLYLNTNSMIIYAQIIIAIYALIHTLNNRHLYSLNNNMHTLEHTLNYKLNYTLKHAIADTLPA